MPRSFAIYLWDIIDAADDILRFTAGKTYEAYVGDSLLKAAVERKFTVIGEAIAQAAKQFPKETTQLTHSERVVSFRNRLVHGYFGIEDATVWSTILTSLPQLREQAQQLLDKSDAPK